MTDLLKELSRLVRILADIAEDIWEMIQKDVKEGR